MDPSELPMNHTPARLKSSSFLNQEPTVIISLGHTLRGQRLELTNEMGAAEGGCLEKSRQSPENVEMPAVLDLRLTERDDSPGDLERW